MHGLAAMTRTVVRMALQAIGHRLFRIRLGGTFVPFDIIVGSTHGDMVPIFGVAVHAGDVLHSTLTYDRDAIGNSGEPGVEAFHPAGSIALALGSGLSLSLKIVQVFDDQPIGSPFQLDTVNALASTTSFSGFDSITMLFQAHGPPDSRSTTASSGPATRVAAARRHREV
jgi:hypothetical protein